MFEFLKELSTVSRSSMISIGQRWAKKAYHRSAPLVDRAAKNLPLGQKTLKFIFRNDQCQKALI